LEKIEIAEWSGFDQHSCAVLHQVNCDRAQLGLAVAKIEVPLTRQVINGVLNEHTIIVLPRMIQIAGSKDGMTRQKI
jgi:hypothetical protein